MLSVSSISFVALIASVVPSVKASIVRRATTPAGETTLAVILKPTDITLGAYQGSFRFAPGSLSIVSVVTPTGDGTRVMNASDTAKGVIRFAGFTVSGFRSEDVLVLVVREKQHLANARLSADLIVATDLQGKNVPASRITPARGLSGEAGRH